MVIASKNASKISAVRMCFPEYHIEDRTSKFYYTYKPENIDTFMCAYRRANETTATPFETVISIEDGVFSNAGRYFISDVCCIKEPQGFRFGCGYFYEISKNMYDYIKLGGNLNDLIHEIENNTSKSFPGGVTSLLSNFQHGRKKQLIKAIRNAKKANLIENPNRQMFQHLNIKRKYWISSVSTEDFKLLDKKCFNAIKKLNGKGGNVK